MASAERVRRQVALAGRVVTEATGEAVPGARVTAQRVGGSARAVSTRTDAAGLFFFVDLPDGDHRVEARPPGAEGRVGTATTVASVARDAEGRVELELRTIALPVTALKGRVLDASTLYPAVVRREPGLVARWRLGEADGPAHDDVGGRHAVPVAPLTRGVTGLLVADDDGAVRFAGAGALEVPFSSDLNPAQFCVELWARVQGGAGTERCAIASRDVVGGSPARGWDLVVSAQDRWELRVGSGTAWKSVAGPSSVDGATVHVVADFDGVTARLFVDGAEAGSTATALAVNTARPLRIGAGRTESAPALHFSGTLDEVALYDRPLPAPRVEAHHDLRREPGAEAPVPLATIRMDGSGEVTLTASDGRFTLPALEPGHRSARASASGFDPKAVEVDLTAGQASDIVVALDRRV